jgi:plasmid stabilization system protein ParE
MRVRWTEPAARDLTEICDYIQEKGSPATARRVALSIHESVAGLAKFPEQGRREEQPPAGFISLPRICGDV